MKLTTRRAFLKTSVAAASTVAVPAVAQSSASPNDRIRVAAIGMHRGLSHALSIAKMQKEGKNVEIAVSCDCDLEAANWAANIVEKDGVKRPAIVQDLRQVMDDKSIDAVTIGTPDHWHALATIWACQANKDVFVEKPLAHTITEGRMMVDAARKYKRMVQVGTQCRSSANIVEGVRQARAGLIGDIYMGRAVAYKLRGDLGRHNTSKPPEGLDWDLFVGAAPKQDYSNFRKRRWYWLKDFCSGDMANQPTHQIDIIRWAMGIEDHPVMAQSMGETLVHTNDDREWPTNQTFSCKFADGRMITAEHRGWYTPNEAGFRDTWPFTNNPDPVVGAILLGTKGYMVFPSYTSYYSFLGAKREPGPFADSPPSDLPKNVQTWQMMDYIHHPNWISACRSRNYKDLNTDVEEGHKSTVLALLGNIALQTEQTVHFDPKTETFPNQPEANQLLTKEYREPFVLPKEV